MIPWFTLYAIKKYKKFSTDIIIGSLHLQVRYHPDTATKTVLELHIFFARKSIAFNNNVLRTSELQRIMSMNKLGITSNDKVAPLYILLLPISVPSAYRSED